MKNKIALFTTIALTMFLGACSNDDVIPEVVKPEPEVVVPEDTVRTISLEIDMPDDPTTRLTLNERGDRTIEVLWEELDEIQLAFVRQLPNGKYQTSLVLVYAETLSEGGKRAHFPITPPTGWTSWTLYGVYAGQYIATALSGEGNKPILQLPQVTENATSLNLEDSSIEKRGDAAMYFKKEMTSADPNALVTFKHLGSIFNITIVNNAATAITDINKKVKLNGIRSTGWAYNHSGIGQFDLVSETFLKPVIASGDEIRFTPPVTELPGNGGTMRVWGWYPASLPGKNWPELELELNYQKTATRSVYNMPPRNTPSKVGMNYSFYAVWDGTGLYFTDNTYTIPTTNELFFSEYVDGPVNEKYLEILNGTGTSIANLSTDNYTVELYRDGATTVSETLTLSDTLNNSKVIIIKNPAATELTSVGGIRIINSDVADFDGNDAIVLKKNGTIIDIIGRIGEDPGTAWTASATLTTEGKTLRRKPKVYTGVTANPSSGFPTLATEWISYDAQYIYLGAHILQ